MSCSACGECAPPLQSLPQAPALPVVPPPPQVPLSHTPQHRAKNILTSQAILEGERRRAIVPPADFAGFVALAEHLDLGWVPQLEGMVHQNQRIVFRRDLHILRQRHRHGR